MNGVGFGGIEFGDLNTAGFLFRSDTIQYVYDSSQVIAEYDGSDTLLRKFIYGPGIDEPICMITYAGGDEDGRYFYHFDALGSVVALSQYNSGNGYASIVEQYTYSAFGETTVCDSGGTPRSPNESLYGNTYLFTGRQWDGETGLYYYRARMYSPTLGRFLQTDPIGYVDSMNLYQYCRNNPINLIDPWGLIILGIHSTKDHAWISYTTDQGATTTLGLWDESVAGNLNRFKPGSDLRIDRERSEFVSKNTASRYYDLTEEQERRFKEFIMKDHSFNWIGYPFPPTNHCASFASDCVLYVTGEDVNADSWWFGVERPRKLRDSIRALEEHSSTKGIATIPVVSDYPEIDPSSSHKYGKLDYKKNHCKK